ncbi:uncharacterized protein LOC142227618 [Haematobia irritans]|uniref:uncharacterized protein LOC142227618 n=1 Tax=Haematobia irritans TaxID=7368 RepID=UPI003F5095E3
MDPCIYECAQGKICIIRTHRVMTCICSLSFQGNETHYCLPVMGGKPSPVDVTTTIIPTTDMTDLDLKTSTEATTIKYTLADIANQTEMRTRFTEIEAEAETTKSYDSTTKPTLARDMTTEIDLTKMEVEGTTPPEGVTYIETSSKRVPEVTTITPEEEVKPTISGSTIKPPVDIQESTTSIESEAETTKSYDSTTKPTIVRDMTTEIYLTKMEVEGTTPSEGVTYIETSSKRVPEGTTITPEEEVKPTISGSTIKPPVDIQEPTTSIESEAETTKSYDSTTKPTIVRDMTTEIYLTKMEVEGTTPSEGVTYIETSSKRVPEGTTITPEEEVKSKISGSTMKSSVDIQKPTTSKTFEDVTDISKERETSTKSEATTPEILDEAKLYTISTTMPTRTETETTTIEGIIVDQTIIESFKPDQNSIEDFKPYEGTTEGYKPYQTTSVSQPTTIDSTEDEQTTNEDFKQAQETTEGYKTDQSTIKSEATTIEADTTTVKSIKSTERFQTGQTTMESFKPEQTTINSLEVQGLTQGYKIDQSTSKVEVTTIESFKAVQTTLESLKPLQTTTEVLKTDQTTIEGIKPEQTTITKLIPDQTTTESYKSDKETTTIYEGDQTTIGEEVTTMNVFTDDQTTPESIKPIQTTTEGIKPYETTTESFKTVKIDETTLGSIKSDQTSVPEQTTTESLKTYQTTIESFKPKQTTIKTATEGFEYGQETTEDYKAGQHTTQIDETTIETIKADQTTSQSFKAVETTTEGVKLDQPTVEGFKPQKTTIESLKTDSTTVADFKYDQGTTEEALTKVDVTTFKSDATKMEALKPLDATTDTSKPDRTTIESFPVDRTTVEEVSPDQTTEKDYKLHETTMETSTRKDYTIETTNILETTTSSLYTTPKFVNEETTMGESIDEEEFTKSSTTGFDQTTFEDTTKSDIYKPDEMTTKSTIETTIPDITTRESITFESSQTVPEEDRETESTTKRVPEETTESGKVGPTKQGVTTEIFLPDQSTIEASTETNVEMDNATPIKPIHEEITRTYTVPMYNRTAEEQYSPEDKSDFTTTPTGFVVETTSSLGLLPDQTKPPEGKEYITEEDVLVETTTIPTKSCMTTIPVVVTTRQNTTPESTKPDQTTTSKELIEESTIASTEPGMTVSLSTEGSEIPTSTNFIGSGETTVKPTGEEKTTTITTPKSLETTTEEFGTTQGPSDIESETTTSRQLQETTIMEKDTTTRKVLQGDIIEGIQTTTESPKPLQTTTPVVATISKKIETLTPEEDQAVKTTTPSTEKETTKVPSSTSTTRSYLESTTSRMPSSDSKEGEMITYRIPPDESEVRITTEIILEKPDTTTKTEFEESTSSVPPGLITTEFEIKETTSSEDLISGGISTSTKLPLEPPSLAQEFPQRPRVETTTEIPEETTTEEDMIFDEDETTSRGIKTTQKPLTETTSPTYIETTLSGNEFEGTTIRPPSYPETRTTGIEDITKKYSGFDTTIAYDKETTLKPTNLSGDTTLRTVEIDDISKTTVSGIEPIYFTTPNISSVDQTRTKVPITGEITTSTSRPLESEDETTIKAVVKELTTTPRDLGTEDVSTTLSAVEGITLKTTTLPKDIESTTSAGFVEPALTTTTDKLFTVQGATTIEYKDYDTPTLDVSETTLSSVEYMTSGPTEETIVEDRTLETTKPKTQTISSYPKDTISKESTMSATETTYFYQETSSESTKTTISAYGTPTTVFGKTTGIPYVTTGLPTLTPQLEETTLQPITDVPSTLSSATEIGTVATDKKTGTTISGFGEKTTLKYDTSKTTMGPMDISTFSSEEPQMFTTKKSLFEETTTPGIGLVDETVTTLGLEPTTQYGKTSGIPYVTIPTIGVSTTLGEDLFETTSESIVTQKPSKGYKYDKPVMPLDIPTAKPFTESNEENITEVPEITTPSATELVKDTTKEPSYKLTTGYEYLTPEPEGSTTMKKLTDLSKEYTTEDGYITTPSSIEKQTTLESIAVTEESGDRKVKKPKFETTLRPSTISDELAKTTFEYPREITTEPAMIFETITAEVVADKELETTSASLADKASQTTIESLTGTPFTERTTEEGIKSTMLPLVTKEDSDLLSSPVTTDRTNISPTTYETISRLPTVAESETTKSSDQSSKTSEIPSSEETTTKAVDVKLETTTTRHLTESPSLGAETTTQKYSTRIDETTMHPMTVKTTESGREVQETPFTTETFVSDIDKTTGGATTVESVSTVAPRETTKYPVTTSQEVDDTTMIVETTVSGIETQETPLTTETSVSDVDKTTGEATTVESVSTVAPGEITKYPVTTSQEVDDNISKTTTKYEATDQQIMDLTTIPDTEAGGTTISPKLPKDQMGTTDMSTLEIGNATPKEEISKYDTTPEGHQEFSTESITEVTKSSTVHYEKATTLKPSDLQETEMLTDTPPEISELSTNPSTLVTSMDTTSETTQKAVTEYATSMESKQETEIPKITDTTEIPAMITTSYKLDTTTEAIPSMTKTTHEVVTSYATSTEYETTKRTPEDYSTEISTQPSVAQATETPFSKITTMLPTDEIKESGTPPVYIPTTPTVVSTESSTEQYKTSTEYSKSTRTPLEEFSTETIITSTETIKPSEEIPTTSAQYDFTTKDIEISTTTTEASQTNEKYTETPLTEITKSESKATDKPIESTGIVTYATSAATEFPINLTTTSISYIMTVPSKIPITISSPDTKTQTVTIKDLDTTTEISLEEVTKIDVSESSSSIIPTTITTETEMTTTEEETVTKPTIPETITGLTPDIQKTTTPATEEVDLTTKILVETPTTLHVRDQTKTTEIPGITTTTPVEEKEESTTKKPKFDSIPTISPTYTEEPTTIARTTATSEKRINSLEGSTKTTQVEDSTSDKDEERATSPKPSGSVTESTQTPEEETTSAEPGKFTGREFVESSTLYGKTTGIPYITTTPFSDILKESTHADTYSKDQFSTKSYDTTAPVTTSGPKENFTESTGKQTTTIMPTDADSGTTPITQLPPTELDSTKRASTESPFYLTTKSKFETVSADSTKLPSGAEAVTKITDISSSTKLPTESSTYYSITEISIESKTEQPMEGMEQIETTSLESKVAVTQEPIVTEKLPYITKPTTVPGKPSSFSKPSDIISKPQHTTLGPLDETTERISPEEYTTSKIIDMVTTSEVDSKPKKPPGFDYIPMTSIDTESPISVQPTLPTSVAESHYSTEKSMTESTKISEMGNENIGSETTASNIGGKSTVIPLITKTPESEATYISQTTESLYTTEPTKVIPEEDIETTKISTTPVLTTVTQASDTSTEHFGEISEDLHTTVSSKTTTESTSKDQRETSLAPEATESFMEETFSTSASIDITQPSAVTTMDMETTAKYPKEIVDRIYTTESPMATTESSVRPQTEISRSKTSTPTVLEATESVTTEEQTTKSPTESISVQSTSQPKATESSTMIPRDMAMTTEYPEQTKPFTLTPLISETTETPKDAMSTTSPKVMYTIEGSKVADDTTTESQRPTTISTTEYSVTFGQPTGAIDRENTESTELPGTVITTEKGIMTTTSEILKVSQTSGTTKRVEDLYTTPLSEVTTPVSGTQIPGSLDTSTTKSEVIVTQAIEDAKDGGTQTTIPTDIATEPRTEEFSVTTEVIESKTQAIPSAIPDESKTELPMDASSTKPSLKTITPSNNLSTTTMEEEETTLPSFVIQTDTEIVSPSTEPGVTKEAVTNAPEEEPTKETVSESTIPIIDASTTEAGEIPLSETIVMDDIYEYTQRATKPSEFEETTVEISTSGINVGEKVTELPPKMGTKMTELYPKVTTIGPDLEATTLPQSKMTELPSDVTESPDVEANTSPVLQMTDLPSTVTEILDVEATILPETVKTELPSEVTTTGPDLEATTLPEAKITQVPTKVTTEGPDLEASTFSESKTIEFSAEVTTVGPDLEATTLPESKMTEPPTVATTEAPDVEAKTLPESKRTELPPKVTAEGLDLETSTLPESTGGSKYPEEFKEGVVTEPTEIPELVQLTTTEKPAISDSETTTPFLSETSRIFESELATTMKSEKFATKIESTTSRDSEESTRSKEIISETSTSFATKETSNFIVDEILNITTPMDVGMESTTQYSSMKTKITTLKSSDIVTKSPDQSSETTIAKVSEEATSNTESITESIMTSKPPQTSSTIDDTFLNMTTSMEVGLETTTQFSTTASPTISSYDQTSEPVTKVFIVTPETTTAANQTIFVVTPETSIEPGYRETTSTGSSYQPITTAIPSEDTQNTTEVSISITTDAIKRFDLTTLTSIMDKDVTSTSLESFVPSMTTAKIDFATAFTTTKPTEQFLPTNKSDICCITDHDCADDEVCIGRNCAKPCDFYKNICKRYKPIYTKCHTFYHTPMCFCPHVQGDLRTSDCRIIAGN